MGVSPPKRRSFDPSTLIFKAQISRFGYAEGAGSAYASAAILVKKICMFEYKPLIKFVQREHRETKIELRTQPFSEGRSADQQRGPLSGAQSGFKLRSRKKYYSHIQNVPNKTSV